MGTPVVQQTHFGPSLVLERTVALINTVGPPANQIATAAAIEQVFATYGEPEIRVSRKELPMLITVVRQLFDVCAAASDDQAASAINRLFVAYAQTPRLTAHDHTRWHLHLDSCDDAPLHEWFATSAALVLAMMLSESGRDGWGICRAEGCGKVFLRTGANRRRNACSDRCATRARVREHRRKQARA
jgi:predicted RNA-binding Zn ribbon-like protein